MEFELRYPGGWRLSVFLMLLVAAGFNKQQT